MAPPPVLRALVSILPHVLGPPAGIYVALRLISLNVPLLFSIPLYIVSAPMFFAASVMWTKHVNRREATKLGAILPPFVEDDSWLGRNVMNAIIQNFDKGYLGQWP